jgi:hypothetical protein
MGDRGTKRSLIALALCYLAFALVFLFVYRAGLAVAGIAMLELFAMLALALGVAWATARKH